MKIAYLSTFYPFRGGIAQFNANLYNALNKDHDVAAFTFTCQYPKFLFPGKTQYVEPGDHAVAVPSRAVLNTANPLSYGPAASKIAAMRPDILIMKYWMSYFAPSLGTVAMKLKRKGCKVITVLDNVIPHERHFFDVPLTKWFLKQNSGFVAMSEAVRNDLLSLRPDAPNIIEAHPLYDHFGAKTTKAEACKALNIDPSKRNILFFGLIRDYKGLDLLIDAFDCLDDDYQLIIAGESYGSFDKYRQRISALRRPEAVKVANRYISDSEVPLFFSAADVCVLPYRSATQSGITSMACHFDLPLIVTDTGGLAESVAGRGIGRVIPEISAASVAETVSRYFEAGSEQFVRNIRTLKTVLTWDRFAAALLDFAARL